MLPNETGEICQSRPEYMVGMPLEVFPKWRAKPGIRRAQALPFKSVVDSPVVEFLPEPPTYHEATIIRIEREVTPVE